MRIIRALQGRSIQLRNAVSGYGRPVDSAMCHRACKVTCWTNAPLTIAATSVHLCRTACPYGQTLSQAMQYNVQDINEYAQHFNTALQSKVLSWVALVYVHLCMFNVVVPPVQSLVNVQGRVRPPGCGKFPATGLLFFLVTRRSRLGV